MLELFRRTALAVLSRERVKHLYGLADELNDTQTEMIGMKPSDVIKLNKVPLVK